ncbi:hypothetical protein P7C70_g2360, partial [Phenoliferia sp. Uapishka_3]
MGPTKPPRYYAPDIPMHIVVRDLIKFRHLHRGSDNGINVYPEQIDPNRRLCDQVMRQGDVPGRAPRRARVARDAEFDKIQPPEATSRLHPHYQWPTVRIVSESDLWYKYEFKAGWCTSVEAAYWRAFVATEDMMDNRGMRWVTWKRTWQTKHWASAGLVEEWTDEQAPWETITID